MHKPREMLSQKLQQEPRKSATRISLLYRFFSFTPLGDIIEKVRMFSLFGVSQPTVCVTCVWAGLDSVWEQKKLEARKMLENAAESHTSGARFVGWRC